MAVPVQPDPAALAALQNPDLDPHNFLDVTFNLNRSTYQPFTKPNTSLQYVHRESNHPPITTKNIPAGINKRLSSLSSDKASFDQAAPPYQKALDESGYHYTLQYEPAKASKRKNRQRNNILWYNPPFSKNTSTNIGHKFLALVDKHFPSDHKENLQPKHHKDQLQLNEQHETNNR